MAGESFKFVGFSLDFNVYAGAEQYLRRLIERTVRGASDHRLWSYVEQMAEGQKPDDLGSLQRRWMISRDAVNIWYRNGRTKKGLRIQLHDPAESDGLAVDARQTDRFLDRRSIISAFMDEFGDPDEPLYSRNLVILGELSDRSESRAIELMQHYVADMTTWDAMEVLCERFREKEARLRGGEGTCS